MQIIVACHDVVASGECMNALPSKLLHFQEPDWNLYAHITDKCQECIAY